MNLILSGSDVVEAVDYWIRETRPDMYKELYVENIMDTTKLSLEREGLESEEIEVDDLVVSLEIREL